VVLPEGIRSAVVEVEGSRIAAVEVARQAPPDADDLGEAVLLPGLVDCHVHVNEPGRTEWEGFATATRAAAVGGITSIVDMPLNSDPVTTSVAALEAKLAAAAGKLHVDCAFWGGVVPGNAHELSPMVACGASGFKAFLCHSGIDDFPASTESDLLRAMPILRGEGVPLLVHAELESELRDAWLDASPRNYLRYLHSRPKQWEDDAIALMIRLAKETGCRVHIVHLSSSTALPMLREAKAAGVPITVETCPHYLCLTAEEVPDGATEYKCAPPIRERANREALWAGLADGTIDLVISDHSPCIPGLKLPDEGDFLEAWGGIASLQLGLSNVWTEARRRGHDLPTITRWMSSAPASLLGWQRGIVAGCRADLVAFHPDQTWTIDVDCLHQRHPLTPYLGREVSGAVVHTWLRGNRIVADGQPVGPPTGRPLLRGRA
jgi:allantoinase